MSGCDRRMDRGGWFLVRELLEALERAVAPGTREVLQVSVLVHMELEDSMAVLCVPPQTKDTGKSLLSCVCWCFSARVSPRHTVGQIAHRRWLQLHRVGGGRQSVILTSCSQHPLEQYDVVRLSTNLSQGAAAPPRRRARNSLVSVVALIARGGRRAAALTSPTRSSPTTKRGGPRSVGGFQRRGVIKALYPRPQ